MHHAPGRRVVTLLGALSQAQAGHAAGALAQQARQRAVVLLWEGR